MTGGFSMVPLGEVLSRLSRPERVDPSKTYRVLGAHWYAKGLYTKDVKLGSEIRAKEVYRVEEGDFIYNRLFAWKGSFALASAENAGCYVSNEFPCFVVRGDRADGRYLWKYFSRASIWAEALGLSMGGTPTSRNRLKEERLLAMEMPLPPPDEQRRIVARIEELAAKIHEARTLRQQAVKEAEALSRASGNSLFEKAADTFGRRNLEELTSRITKGESPEWQGFGYQDTGPLFIRSENVLWGALDLRGAVRIPEEFHRKLSRSQLHAGDALINLVGASIGRACVVPGELGEANVNQAVAVITPDLEMLSPEYLVHFLLSPTAQDIIHGGKVETARPNISLGDLRGMKLPLPPILEQRRIVAYLDGLQVKVDELKRLQAETAAELNALIPSILDRAFKGEL
jgi:type I restriction enzyme S subunit